MRLDKLLANSGVGTRSEVKKMIASGRVMVNGSVSRDPSTNVSEDDSIKIDGNEADTGEFLYFIFDKPDCVLTAMDDARQECVGNFIPKELKGKHLSPVGRLDYHTTGLLIITNDGELSHKITSPKYKINKTYLVEYEGEELTNNIAEELAQGITLTDMDKPVKLAPCRLELLNNNKCKLILTEGKTHEVRRIIAHYGRSVVTLRRISIGPLSITEEPTGELRPMTKDEIHSLKCMF